MSYRANVIASFYETAAANIDTVHIYSDGVSVVLFGPAETHQDYLELVRRDFPDVEMGQSGDWCVFLISCDTGNGPAYTAAPPHTVLKTRSYADHRSDDHHTLNDLEDIAIQYNAMK